MNRKRLTLLIAIGWLFIGGPSSGALSGPVTVAETGARFILFHSTNLHGEIEPCG